MGSEERGSCSSGFGVNSSVKAVRDPWNNAKKGAVPGILPASD